MSLGSREVRLQEKGRHQGGMKLREEGCVDCILGDNNLSKNYKQERARLNLHFRRPHICTTKRVSLGGPEKS